MNRKEILEKLEVIFRKVFEDHSIKISEGMTNSDIERWDSLSHLLMFKEVESNFKIKFGIMEMAEVEKISDIIDKIQIKLKQIKDFK